MAGEVHTFSEDAIRRIVRHIVQEERASIARQMIATRRHEGVFSVSSGVTIVVAKQVLYAAFGGGFYSGDNIDYGSAESNALLISNGNYVPISSGSLATAKRRVFYPRSCYVCTVDSDNVLQVGSEEISVINPGGLPIPQYSQFAVMPLEGTEHYIPIEKPSDICHNGKIFISEPSFTLDGDGTPKIIRSDWQLDINPSLSGANLTTDFCHTDGDDVYIHHPGVYEVTFGMSVSRTSGDSADDTQWTDSNGDTIDLPNTMHFTGALFTNYNPASGNIATQFSSGTQIGVSVGPRDSSLVSTERTIMINHTLDNWHGQPYMRLSFAAKCQGGGVDAASASGLLQQCWVHIKPLGGGGFNEGSGYNAFLGSSGSFQWYGGGTEPTGTDFDEDGV